MIHVDEPTKIIFVRGVYTMADVEQAFLEQTGKKRWHWRAYTICGLADDNSRGLQTGMGFQPPMDDGPTIGFKIPKHKK